MAKNSEPVMRCCNNCGVVLTKENQSEALVKNKRKLCSPCGAKRTASYSDRYKDAQNLKMRLLRAAKPSTRPSAYDRLVEKIDAKTPDECWPWTGAINKQTGYGAFRLNGRPVAANRAVLEIISGVDMTGLVARHKCDNRGCVNPSHLEPGTQAENMRDAVVRGRTCNGQLRVDAALNAKNVARRKITEVEALTAFNLVKSGAKRKDVAAQFGITRDAIDKLMIGDAWSHITGVPCKRHIWNKEGQTS